MHLCGGLGTPARACVTANVKLAKFTHCDTDPVATQTAAELLQRLHQRHPSIISKEATRAFDDLPANIYDITEDVVKRYVAKHGPPQLLMADFPCQDVSRAGDQAGVEHGERSSLIFHIVDIIRWFKNEGDTKFIVENVYFKEHLPEDHDLVSRLLGVSSLDFDAALISPSHRLRSYWTDVPGAAAPEERRADLEDVLELEHIPGVAVYDDFAPMAVYNKCGELRLKAVTAVASGENTYSYRNGSALVKNIFTNLLEAPFIEEKERMVGLVAGDTESSVATMEDRHRMVGNIFDANVMAHFLTTLAAHLDLTAAAARASARPILNVSSATRQRKKITKKAGRTFMGNEYCTRVADDMLKRQPWLETHSPSAPAAQAERPADVKSYLVQRRDIYINVPVPKVPFRNGQAEMLKRFSFAKQTINGMKRNILTVNRRDGLPTALHWVVPPAADAPGWQHDLHNALHQPTSLDDSNDVFASGARLDVPSLRRMGFEKELCDELEHGESYQLERKPEAFERNNYGS